MSSIVSPFRFALAAGLALLLSTHVALAEDDREALSAVDAMRDHYAALDEASVQAIATLNGLPPGVKGEPIIADVALASDGRFSVRPTSVFEMLIGSDQSAVFDGETLAIIMPSMNLANVRSLDELQRYGAHPAIGALRGSYLFAELMTTLDILMTEAGALTRALVDLEYVERDDSHTPPRHILKATGAGPYASSLGPAEITFEIDDSETPWLRAIAVVPPPDPRARPGSTPLTVQFRLDDWSRSAPDGAFEIPEIPADYDSVPNLSAAIRQRMARDRMPANTTRVRPAPTFALPTLDGDTFDLAEYRGKVVIIDFWATWCAPCIASLPGVAKLANDLGDDVVLAAINLREPNAKVQRFIQDRGWKFPVVMDRGTVGQKYGVNPIPHTIVVDRKGDIVFEQIGVGPNAKEQLEFEVRKALGQ